METPDAIGNVPDGVYARIPIGDLTVEQARGAVEDDTFWDQTMPAVLHAFPQLTRSDYEQLTVFQHRLFVEFVSNEEPDGDA